MTNGIQPYCVVPEGTLWTFYASISHDVFPTLYLKPNIKITSGLGTSSNPFVLSLNE